MCCAAGSACSSTPTITRRSTRTAAPGCAAWEKDGFDPIEIGDECWFALRSTVLKNTVLPPRTIVASHSMTSGPYDIPGASMIAGSPARLVRTGVYRDKDDDTIDYDA